MAIRTPNATGLPLGPRVLDMLVDSRGARVASTSHAYLVSLTASQLLVCRLDLSLGLEERGGWLLVYYSAQGSSRCWWLPSVTSASHRPVGELVLIFNILKSLKI